MRNYATTKMEDRPKARFDSQVVDGQIVITAMDGRVHDRAGAHQPVLWAPHGHGA